MLPVEVLHLSKTHFKGHFGGILYPDKRGIVLITSSHMLRRHKNYWCGFKLILLTRKIKLRLNRTNEEGHCGEGMMMSFL